MDVETDVAKWVNVVSRKFPHDISSFSQCSRKLGHQLRLKLWEEVFTDVRSQALV